MGSRGRHPKNAINSALRALPEGFEVVEVHRGHRWGAVRCLACGADTPIWSTPRVPEDNVSQIWSFVRQHQRAHREEEP